MAGRVPWGELAGPAVGVVLAVVEEGVVGAVGEAVSVGATLVGAAAEAAGEGIAVEVIFGPLLEGVGSEAEVVAGAVMRAGTAAGVLGLTVGSALVSGILSGEGFDDGAGEEEAEAGSRSGCGVLSEGLLAPPVFALSDRRLIRGDSVTGLAKANSPVSVPPSG